MPVGGGREVPDRRDLEELKAPEPTARTIGGEVETMLLLDAFFNGDSD